MSFQKGNKQASGGVRRGAGRKSRDREAELEKILKRAIDDNTRDEIFKSLAARAKDGDTKAAALVLSYLYGRPPQLDEVEIDARVEAEINAFLVKVEEVVGKEAVEKIIAAVVSGLN